MTSPRARRRPHPSFSATFAVALLLGGASLAFAQEPAAPTGSPSAPPSVSSATAHPYAGHVAEAAYRFGIPEAWIWSVMRMESAGNPVATSHAGAIGLMQVMPGTYAELRSRHGLGPDPYDRRDNILAGAAYLRELHDRYGPTGMLAAYNAGPGRWEDYVSRSRPLPAETVAYMARLGGAISGSAADSPIVVAQVDRFAWRRASLFITLHERGQDSSSGAANVQHESIEAEPSSVALGTLAGDFSTTPIDTAGTLFAIRRPE